jgi:hypothetical protein
MSALHNPWCIFFVLLPVLVILSLWLFAGGVLKGRNFIKGQDNQEGFMVVGPDDYWEHFQPTRPQPPSGENIQNTTDAHLQEKYRE